MAVEQEVRDDGGSATSASLTITAPVSGHKIQAIIAIDKASGAISMDSTGFTLVTQTVNTDVSLSIYQKTSDGTETSIDWSWANTRSWNSCVQVISNATYDQANTANSGTTSVTSQASGTTGTLADENNQFFAAFCSDTGTNTQNRSYTNSFTELASSSSDASSGRPGLYVASLTRTGDDSAISTTLTVTDTGDQQIGAIVAYGPAAGGGLSIPVAAYNYRRRR